ncbi:MAG TPA: hypothetical protein VFV40_02325 [Nocardioides sp.]|nr:hypothetical protein [Nocardioides sp.]
MTNPQTTPAVRRVTRALVLVPVILLSSALPATAAPSDWPEAPSVSVLEFLLVILLIPAGIALVIALLAAIPSMRGGGSTYQPGLAWRHEAEWFGGPRDGLEKADKSDPEAIEAAGERGGASGHW